MPKRPPAIGTLSETAFEEILIKLCAVLTKEAQSGKVFTAAKEFETRVRQVLSNLLEPYRKNVDFAPAAQVFPDIVVDQFGVEVKFTTNDTWRSVDNSVFEGTRSESVEQVYLVFGKFGGRPEVKWDRYEDAVMHVRTSHVPRFEVQIDAETSLFSKIGISYQEFRILPQEERMQHIRRYARGRLRDGERLWWLDDSEDATHSLPIQARLYTKLDQSEKRRLQAEASILCPEVVRPSRSKDKYNDVAFFLLTHHGVLCHQARDLFSAGSAAMRTDQTRGGNYLLRALKENEQLMTEAAGYLPDELFVEYWGEAPPKELRLSEWLRRADRLARDWRPSEHLFRTYQRDLSSSRQS